VSPGAVRPPPSDATDTLYTTLCITVKQYAYVLNVCTVVASRTAVSDPPGSKRLSQASIGTSVAGIVVSVVVVVIIVALFI